MKNAFYRINKEFSLFQREKQFTSPMGPLEDGASFPSLLIIQSFCLRNKDSLKMDEKNIRNVYLSHLFLCDSELE